MHRMNKVRSSQNLALEQNNLSPLIHINIPADLKYLNVIAACVTSLLEREVNLPAQRILISQVELALHEACTNIIEHAYVGMNGHITIYFSIVSQPHRLIIDLFDRGKTFSINDIPPPDLGIAHTSGYGIFLIRELLDEVLYEPEFGNNHWRLVKHLEQVN
jgi:serine/threonine-protein kinase RsbW